MRVVFGGWMVKGGGWRVEGGEVRARGLVMGFVD